ncbi:hypothetical protein [Psychroflexus planctonicus]|uniref:Ferredoxin subunit of nitrite reductase or a ring-hydroxylating dioxygenase n=1 Tax=Psychroflexus planctonicus TaxID=1526575 RepID=A0ABQ1SCV9_9FLAO|nr:hypothetical protein [Psychroflexus planctonicus]GGE26195.1 hypothetical protein GCM10010832_03640 [Psychroflexus planctonicus]
MKKIWTLLLISTLFLGCEDDDMRRENPYLLNLRIDVTINTNLPQYNSLNFPGNAVYYPGVGNDGIIIVNTGPGIVAWDASDPNEVPRDCTRLQIQGLSAETTCEPPNAYSLVDGQPLESGELQFGLFNYRVEENGNVIRVFN